MIELVCALFLIAQSASVTSGNGTVSGEIRDADGSPVRAVRISAMPVGEPSTFASIAETDASGRYRLENIPPGRYYISAGIIEQPTYYPGVGELNGASAVSIDARAALEQIDFRLVRAGGVRVVGRLIDGDPDVTGLNLYAADGREPVQTAALKSDGSFEFVRVPPGQYSIWLDGNLAYSHVVWSSERLEVTNKEIQGVELRSVPYVRTAGQATVPDDGPLPEFGLTLQGPLGWFRTRAAFTNRQDGAFNFVLPVGEYKVVADVHTAGYRVEALTYEGTNVLNENVRMNGQVGKLAARFSLTGAAPWRRIRGYVTGLTNIPAWTGPLRVDLSLDSVGLWGEASVNPDGSFEFSKVLPGTYLILPPGLRSTRLVVGGSDIEDLRFHVPPHREVIGEVLMEKGETLPASFDVMFSSPQGWEYYASHTKGSFYALLPEGEFVPVFRFPVGYVMSSAMQASRDLRRQTLKVGEKNDAIRVFLRPAQGLRVRGRSVLPAPANEDSREVSLLGPGIHLRTTMNADGTFEFVNVPPGNYTVTASSFMTTNLIVGNQDIADVLIRPLEQSYVRSRMSTEGGSVPPQASLLFEPVTSDANKSSIRISVGETESQTAVPSGTYRLASVDVPRNKYRVEWARRGPVDLLKEAMTLSPSEPSKAIPDGDTIEVRVSVLPSRPSRKVSGRIVAAEIPPIVALTDSYGNTVQSAVDKTGNFEFEKVSSGIYRFDAGVFALYADPAPLKIVVTEDDMSNVIVTIPTQREIRGRIQIEGGSTLPPLALLVWHERTLGQPSVGLTPRGGHYVPLNISRDGTFEISMPEGSHRLEITGFPGAFYRLTSVDFGGTDVLKGRLTINGPTLPELLIKLQFVEPDIMSNVRGKLSWATGLRPTRVSLTKESRYSYPCVFVAPLSPDGSFVFENVPPGTYSLNSDPPVAGMLPRRLTVQASRTADADLKMPTMVQTRVRVRSEGLADPNVTFTIRLNTDEPYRVYGSRSWAAVQPTGWRCVGDTCSYRPAGLHLNEPSVVRDSQTDGSFDMLLPEGEHRIEINAAPQGRLKTAKQGNIDLLKSPLRVGEGFPAEILLTFD